MYKELTEQIINNYRVSFKNKLEIYIDDIIYTIADFGDFVYSIIITDKDAALNFYETFKDDRAKKQFYKNLFQKVRTEVSQKTKDKYKSKAIPESGSRVDYIPVVNLKTNDAVLINPNTLSISEFSYDVWIRNLNADEKKAIKDSERIANFVYDPYNIETLVMSPFEDYEVLKVNRYNPPKWRKLENTNSKCPKIIKKLLIHLFPDRKVRNYVLDWLHWALVARNEAYLVLNGAKGIGKGVFCSLVKSLVGFENYIEAPDSFLESDFNSTLDSNRVILLDEFRVDKAKHLKLKRYINKFQNIEKKGIDADKSIEIYNSYIVSNNDLSDMHLEYDDRRFSVADMTDIPLLETIDLESLNDFHRNVLENEDSEVIREFGYFIYNRGAKEHNQFSVFKGTRYYQLVDSSLRVWQKYILEEVLKGDSPVIDLAMLSRRISVKDSRSRMPRIEKVQDFLNNYRYEGIHRLGETFKELGDWNIRVNPELVNVEEDEGDLL